MKRTVTRLISILLVLTMCLSCFPLEVFAWGKMSHVYTANLIEGEMLNGNGKGSIAVPYDGDSVFEYEIPDEYYEAIMAYPDYFRAGALGPDVYPDIFTGQVYIHPEDEVDESDPSDVKVESGQWIASLCTAVNKMGKDTEDRKMCLSFTLGCILHYCGDLFGHDFVNTFSGGAFPSFFSTEIFNIKGERLNNILSHLSTESYMDELVYPNYDVNRNGGINGPNKFIAAALIFNDTPAGGLNSIYTDYPPSITEKLDEIKAAVGDIWIVGGMLETLVEDIFDEDGNNVPPHYTAMLNLREFLTLAADEYRENMEPVSAGITAFCDAWAEDVDEGMVEFTATCDRIASRIITGEKNPDIEKKTEEERLEEQNQIWVSMGVDMDELNLKKLILAYRPGENVDRMLKEFKDAGIREDSFFDILLAELVLMGYITTDMLKTNDSTISIIKEELSYWMDEYGNYMLFIPDFIIDGIEIPIIGDLLNMITELFKAPLYPFFEGAKAAIKSIFANWVIGVCTGTISDYTGWDEKEVPKNLVEIISKVFERLDNPEVQLDHEDNPYKPFANNFADLKGYMDVVASEAKYEVADSDFEALYNTITMFELVLMGPENYSKFIKQYAGVDQTSYQTNTASPEVTSLKVRITTSDLFLAGTNDNIYMVVERVNADGSRTEIKSKLLDHAYHDDFEQGDTQTYIVELPKSVKLSQLEIGLKKRPGFDLLPGITDDWVCENIRVTPMYAGYELTTPIDLGGVSMAGIVNSLGMNFQQAMKVRENSANKKTQKSQIVTNLKVEIKVKDELYAGSDSDIYLKAVFGKTYWKTVLLDKGEGHNDLERGDTERYNIPITNVATGTAMGIPLDQLYVEFRHFGKDEANWAEVKVIPCYGSLELTTPITLGGARFQERTWTSNLQTALKKASYRKEPALSQTATSLDIQVNVANELGAGTDDDIYLQIYSNGSKTPAQKVALDKEGYNDFEQADSDVYTVVLNEAAAKIPLDQMRLVFERKRLLPKTDAAGNPTLIHYEDEANWDEVLVTAYNGSHYLTDPISVGGTEFEDDLWDTNFQTNLKLHYGPVVLEYETNIDDGLLYYMDSLDGGEEWVDDQNELWANTSIRREVFLRIFKGFAPEITCESSTKSAEITLNFTGVWNGVSNDRRSQVKEFEHVYAVEGTADVEFINDKGQSVHEITGVKISKNKAVITGYANKNLVEGYYDLKVTYKPDKTNQYYAATEVTLPRAVNLTVAPMEITKEPAHQNVKPGEAASLSIEVSGGKAPYTYTWQVLNGDKWEDVKKGSQYSGVGTAKLTFTPKTAGSTSFRCVVKDSYGNEVTSKSAGVNAVGAALLLKQPGSTNIDLGTTATLTVGASGGIAPYTYKWQVLNGDKWEDVKNDSNRSGQGTTTLKFKPDKAGSTQFRCVVKDSAGGEAISVAAKVTATEVAPLVIKTQPKNVTVVPGITATLTVAASGGTAPYTYEWKILDGPGWTTIKDGDEYSGQGTSTLKVTFSTETITSFICVIKDSAGKEIESDGAIVMAKDNSEPLTITTQPKDLTAYRGEVVTLTVAASGGKAPYKYTWQSDGGNGWSTLIEGENALGQGTDTLLCVAYNSKVRCVITDGAGNSVTSNAATITAIEPDPIEIFIQPNDVTGPKGMIVNIQVEARGGVEPLTYQWQVSNDGNSWTNLKGTETGVEIYNDGRSVAVDTEVTYFYKYIRCVIYDAAGQSVTSRVATIKLTEKLAVTVNNGETSVTVSANDPNPMVLTANVKGGEAPYTYTWTIYFWGRSEVLSTSSTCELYGASAYANATLKVEVKDSTGKKVTSSTITVKVTDIVN